MPLEGQWWADDMSAFTADDKARWKWTMMIMQPDFVEAADIQNAIAKVQQKKALAAVMACVWSGSRRAVARRCFTLAPFHRRTTVQRVHDFIDAEVSANRKAPRNLSE